MSLSRRNFLTMFGAIAVMPKSNLVAEPKFADGAIVPSGPSVRVGEQLHSYQIPMPDIYGRDLLAPIINLAGILLYRSPYLGEGEHGHGTFFEVKNKVGFVAWCFLSPGLYEKVRTEIRERGGFLIGPAS